MSGFVRSSERIVSQRVGDDRDEEGIAEERRGSKEKRGRTVDVDHSGPMGVLSLCSCCAAEV